MVLGGGRTSILFPIHLMILGGRGRSRLVAKSVCEEIKGQECRTTHVSRRLLRGIPSHGHGVVFEIVVLLCCVGAHLIVLLPPEILQTIQGQPE